MGTINQGITGGFSGKVGTVIGVKWNDIDYMKGIPSKIANPRSESQKNQRAKVSLIIKFLRPLNDFLRVGFKKQAIKMSAFNVATSYNLTHAINGANSELRIDYSKVMLSQGKLPAAINPVVNSPANGKVEFSWQDNSSNQSGMPTDRALLLIYNPEKGKVFTVEGGNSRVSGSQVVTLPPEFPEGEVQCYISFQSANQTAISDSRYAGAVVV